MHFLAKSPKWHTSQKRAGQGATEYLVLLAVVLIIALVSIALLGFFPGTANDSRMAQSKAYWTGVASPIEILETSPSSMIGGSYFGCAVGMGFLRENVFSWNMVILNNGIEPLNITGIRSTGSQFNESCLYPTGPPGQTFIINPGQQKRIIVVDRVSWTDPYTVCTPKSTYELPMAFIYNSPYLKDKTQIGNKPLIVQC
jgi:hypothetical protein